MNPNWPGSIIGSRTCFNAMSMMKLSATFERVGVREIGFKSSLILQIEDALGRGQTLANFHASGTLHSKNEVFRISAIGAARIYAKFLSTQLGRLSGPLAREAFSSKSFLATECSVTDIGRSSAIPTRIQSDRAK